MYHSNNTKPSCPDSIVIGTIVVVVCFLLGCCLYFTFHVPNQLDQPSLGLQSIPPDSTQIKKTSILTEIKAVNRIVTISEKDIRFIPIKDSD